MKANNVNFSTLSDVELDNKLASLWWSLNGESWGRDWEGKNECLIEYERVSSEWLKRHRKPQSSLPARDGTGRKCSPLARLLEEG